MDEPLGADVLDFAHRMFELARNGMTQELLANVEGGLPVDLTNDKGDTLLILAAYHAHAQTVRALLTAGADHSRVNDRGQTALGSAVFRRADDAIVALLEAGADPQLGRQSAIAVAQFFELDEQLALLQR
jgi:ankyrin repeat protein